MGDIANASFTRHGITFIDTINLPDNVAFFHARNRHITEYLLKFPFSGFYELNGSVSLKSYSSCVCFKKVKFQVVSKFG